MLWNIDSSGKYALSVEFRKFACWKSTTRRHEFSDLQDHVILVRLTRSGTLDNPSVETAIKLNSDEGYFT